MVSLLEHPDSQELFDRTYSLLMFEADRGCVLLGVSLLDEELTKLFKSLLPEDTSNKRKKEIFDGKGAFGNLSAKLDIAHVCNILPVDLVNCIHRLNKLRNDLAHQASPFSIDENLELIFEIFSKTKGNLAAGIVHMSGDFVYGQFIKKVMETDHPTDEGRKLFDSQEEAVSYLEKNDQVKTKLSEQRIKTMFAIGIASLGAIIILHREKMIDQIASKA
ncbi:hypothetical protein ACU6U9_17270 [Pseudomonas sp. HK3]